jgi:hypothetical protein
VPFLAFNQINQITLQHYQNLCSNKFAGRGYVNEGIYHAQNYILNYLKDSIGLQPVLDNQLFIQNFTHPVNTFPNTIELIVKGKKLVAGEDFIVHPGSNSFEAKRKVYYLDTLSFKTKTELTKILSKLPQKSILVCKSGVTNNKTFYKEISQYYQQNLSNHCVVFLHTKKLTWGVLPVQFNNCFLDVLEDKFNATAQQIKIKVQAKFIQNFSVNNIIATNQNILPTDSCIVICAHYDHLGKMGQNTTFYGANDNASGVAMLLDLAKKFKVTQTKFPIVFIAFAGEELGLLGSKFFVDNLPKNLNIKLVLNLDMVSAGENGLTVANANNNNVFFETIRDINSQKNYLPVIVPKNGSANSDHFSFHEAGYPAIFIYTLGNYKHYHDTEDKFQNLNLQFYPKTFNLLSDFILTINGRN